MLRELPRMRRGFLPYLEGLSRRYPDRLLYIAFGKGDSYIVNHPELAEEVLVRLPERFQRSKWLGELRHLVGSGLLTSAEAEWVPQRRRLNPAYHGRHAGVVDEATRAEAAALVGAWRAAEGSVVDVQRDVKAAMLRALVRIMFSPDVAVDAPRVIADLDALLSYISMTRQTLRPLARRVGLGRRAAREVGAAIGRLDAFIAGVVDGCRSGEMRSGLLLAALLPAEAEGEIDAENVHDEVGTLLLAGFDTTAALVTFALYNLAGRPDLVPALRAEAGGRAQPLLEAVLRETLRLHPAVWAMHRMATEPVTLDGWDIAPGENVLVSPYAIHRNPAFWERPDAFLPERFADAPAADALLGARYLPFSQGRHTCIGKRMALQQARLMVSEIVAAFDLARAGRPPRLVGGVILRAARGLPLRLTSR